jgi:hypothetical protein
MLRIALAVIAATKNLLGVGTSEEGLDTWQGEASSFEAQLHLNKIALGIAMESGEW